MAARDVHYELFMRRTAKAAWSLISAFEDRKDAVEEAKSLAEQYPNAGVKVAKETFNAKTGDFLTVNIFEHGLDEDKGASRDNEAAIPCFQPEDLYSLHARHTIGRVLKDYLSRQTITVTELLHRADAIERLEVNGMEMQHAVQKVAIAHAEDKNQPVQGVIKLLNELVKKAIERVYKDAEAGKFRDIGKDGLVGVLKAGKKGAPGYLVSAAIARRLAKEKSWGKKLAALLALLEDLPKDGDDRDVCLEAIDQFIAEILEDYATLPELLGEQEHFGAEIAAAIDLFLGEAPATAKDAIKTLARLLQGDSLSAARAALARRILSELKNGQRMCPASFGDEIKLTRKLASRIVLGQGKYLSAGDIMDAFSRRCRRFVTPEGIDSYLKEAGDERQRVSLLLDLEENIVGAENRRRLAGVLLAEIKKHHTEDHFVRLKQSSVHKLSAISEIQKRIRDGGFETADIDRLSAAADALAVAVETQLGLLAAIEKQTISAAEKVIAVLRLIDRGVLTDGECAMRAKRLALKLMRNPAFMDRLVRNDASDSDPRALLAELKSLLTKTGLNQVSGDKPKAAPVGVAH